MKPFDLEKALAGAKLVTREGCEVISFGKNEDNDDNDEYPYQAIFLSKTPGCFTKSGGYYVCEDHENDLFLADEEEPPMEEPNNIPEGCLPFDLEKALAGHPVVTANGNEVTGLHDFVDAEGDYPIIGLLYGKQIRAWSRNGESLSPIHNLFLKAPKKVKRTGWMAIMKPSNYLHKASTTNIYEHKSDAERAAESTDTLIAIVPIEWEEPEE